MHLGKPAARRAAGGWDRAGPAGWGLDILRRRLRSNSRTPWLSATLPEPNQAERAHRRVGGTRQRSLCHGLTLQTSPQWHEAEMKVYEDVFYFPVRLWRVQRHFCGWGRGGLVKLRQPVKRGGWQHCVTFPLADAVSSLPELSLPRVGCLIGKCILLHLGYVGLDKRVQIMQFHEQLARVKAKLAKAKSADKNFKVFGASSHKYNLNRPATSQEVLAFETEYGVHLPEAYRAFITHIGNGGSSHADSAAGPFYGVYPLGENVDELVYTNTKEALVNPCIIHPKMSDEYWKSLTKIIDENDNISDNDFEQELSKIYAGILPIGSQGCAYLHGIILNGPHQGRIVYLDVDRQKPQFAFENNFLDWYERWLDEVISGELRNDGPSWFGYCKGGSPNELWTSYLCSSSLEDKRDSLNGLLNKSLLPTEIINQIGLVIDDAPEDRGSLIQLICKSDYEHSKPYLIELAKTNLLSVFKFVYWYAKNNSLEWLNFIRDNIERINDEETFRFCTYLLKETQADYSRLIIPFTKSEKENIRVQAFYTLGQLANKKNYLETFIEGLKDESNRVVHSTLQALDGVKDERLLEYYKYLAEKFPVEKDYVLSNLNHRLADYGLTNKTILGMRFNGIQGKAKWFEIWK
jgi:hypothetical protein